MEILRKEHKYYNKITQHPPEQARKAYSFFLILGAEYSNFRETWRRIELDEEAWDANLALSGEEDNILHSVKMPLFIEGRAGSGKSTMLFYLFAGYCNQKLNAHTKPNADMYSGNPIFLTYNDSLVNKARKNVVEILKTNISYSQEEENISEKMTPFFHSFLNFIKALLPYDMSEEFDSNYYVSFSKFKKLFQEKCNLPKRKDDSPEFVWHIIRSLIKGYSVQDYLALENYNKIYTDDRTVDAAFLKHFGNSGIKISRLSRSPGGMPKIWYDAL